MYDIKWIREHPDDFDKALGRRPLTDDDRLRFSSKTLLTLDGQRRAAITTFEQAQARRNSASKEIGEAKKKKDDAAAQKLMAEVNELKVTLPALEAEQKKLGDELDKELAQIPNLRPTMCRMARMRPAMSSIISPARNATTRSSPSSI